METIYKPEKCVFKECAFPHANCRQCVASERNKDKYPVPKINARSNYFFLRKFFRH